MPRPRLLPLTLLVVAGAFAPPGAALAQSRGEAGKSFERKHIDAAEYRDEQALLYDWPELTGLVLWSRALQAAVAEEDQTVSAELLGEFRARVDSLRAAPRPDFLAGRADSVRAALTGIDRMLARAEGMLSAAPEPVVTPRGGAVAADPGRQRTIVTGSTAVTVPRGVAVGGARDSLPVVAIEGGGTVNFLDLVALALGELDRLVHLTRSAGAPRGDVSSSPPDRAATTARNTPPPPAAP